MNYFVYVEGILGVETNAKAFEWSYGTVAPISSKTEYDKCQIKVSIDVRNDGEVFENDKAERVYGKFHYFSGNPGENKVYYERNYFFGKKLRYSISVEKTKVEVIVGKTYFKKIHHRIMNLHSLGYIMTDIISGLLLLNGYSTLHCSAVNMPTNNHSIILFAPPNTGKTLTSMRLCKQHNANFIAEDFAITDGVSVWAVPWTSTFRLYDEVNESKWDKFVNKATSVIPALELIKTSKNKAIDSYIGGDRILMKSVATDVVVLERGAAKVDHDKSDALRKLLTLNRYEFNYHKAPTMVVLCYFNHHYSQEEMYNCEKQILSRLLDNTEYTCVTDMNALNYSETVFKELV